MKTIHKRIITAIVAALVIVMAIMCNGVQVQAAELGAPDTGTAKTNASNRITITTDGTWTWDADVVDNEHKHVIDIDDMVTDWALLIDGSGSMKGLDEQIKDEVREHFGEMDYQFISRFDLDLYEDLNRVTNRDTDIVGAIAETVAKGYRHIVVVTDGRQDPADYSALPEEGYGDVDVHILFVGHIDEAAANELISILVERLDNSSVTSYNLFSDGDVENHKDDYVRRTIEDEESQVLIAQLQVELAQLQAELDVVTVDLDASEQQNAIQQYQIDQLQKQVDDANLTIESVCAWYLKSDPYLMIVFFIANLLVLLGLFIIIMQLIKTGYDIAKNWHDEKMKAITANNSALDKLASWFGLDRINNK